LNFQTIKIPHSVRDDKNKLSCTEINAIKLRARDCPYILMALLYHLRYPDVTKMSLTFVT
jgi:hypothetical protein